MRDVGSTDQRGLHVLFLKVRRPRVSLRLAHRVLHGGRLAANFLHRVHARINVVVVFITSAAGTHVLCIATIASLSTGYRDVAGAVHALEALATLLLSVEVDEVVLLRFVVLEAGRVVLLLSAARSIVAHVLSSLGTADRLQLLLQACYLLFEQLFSLLALHGHVLVSLRLVVLEDG